MKIILGILQALFYLPINLFVTAIAWIISPVLPLFASSDGWLPRWLWWFQTPDNSIDGDHSFNKPSLTPTCNKITSLYSSCVVVNTKSIIRI